MDDFDETDRQEENEDQDQEEKENHDQDNNQENDEERRKRHEKELKKLLETLKALEEEKKRRRGKKPPRVIRLEFGTAYHKNPLVNFMMYYFMNLVVMISLLELFGFVEYDRSLGFIFLFVATYTFLEMLFRNYVLYNHFPFVMNTMGFIFFFGYLTIFYIVEHFIFPDLITFEGVTFIIIFMGAFIVFRYVLAHMIKRIILKTVR